MGTYNLYCDESTHLKNDGNPYMLISYVSSPYIYTRTYGQQILAIKRRHKFKGEIKWTSVSKSSYPFYAELVAYFFSTDLKFRSVIVEKAKIDHDRTESFDEFYYKMYYQLLHHKIDMNSVYNVYLDIKDTRSHKKIAKLKDILSHHAAIRNLQSIRSHESQLMQLADLIMGAINYKNRGLNKVIAKMKLIELIESHTKLPLTKTTPKYKEKFNLFFIDLN
jgi:Protein of unknown function (DUF3800)